MARMLVIYRRPKDPAAFDEHYFSIHVPLAKQLPGIRKYTVSRGPIAGLASAKDAYFVASLEFDTLEAIREAFSTDQGSACAEDRKILAADEDVEMFLFDTEEV
jgi:uncharacterized protein (TIGR02118 family)